MFLYFHPKSPSLSIPMWRKNIISHCRDEETTLQLLFPCDYAQEVWKLIPCTKLLNSQTIQQTRKGMEESKKLVCLPPTGVGSGPISPWVLWSLWKSQNRKAFNGTE
ncbi:unnamed protein product [Microthlaspi erraticum]|uniref:Uncharacterized protein n=1 Tax=Microthlaspi erraticum TaxID=1685480 RepID=A0A6D2KM92_9BRAS|nr:unnamed protein product [Microthlaspi erraticum]